jgi:hypothetical protein
MVFQALHGRWLRWLGWRNVAPHWWRERPNFLNFENLLGGELSKHKKAQIYNVGWCKMGRWINPLEM